jgi:hypothetical protein
MVRTRWAGGIRQRRDERVWRALEEDCNVGARNVGQCGEDALGGRDECSGALIKYNGALVKACT